MATAASIDPVPVPSLAPSTNPFTFIHKSIRLALAELLVELGRANFSDVDSKEYVIQKLDDVLAYCERHLEHEERFVRPACAGRFALDAFDQGHPEHERQIAQLRSLMTTLRRAQPRHAQSIGMTLYLAFSVFVADCLVHMAEEEQVLAPSIVCELSEAEQGAIQAKIAQSMSPEDGAKSAYLMLISSNRTERRVLVEKLLLQAPRAQLLSLLEQARPRLEQDDHADLVRRVLEKDK